MRMSGGIVWCFHCLFTIPPMADEFPIETCLPVSALESIGHHCLGRFIVWDACICRETSGVHNKLYLNVQSLDDRWHHGIIIDWFPFEPTTSNAANNSSSSPCSHTLCQCSDLTSPSSAPQPVQDHATRFQLYNGDIWWTDARVPTEHLIKKVRVESVPPLTLSHVALITHSMNQHKPQYDILSMNCWWFSRCCGLLLEIIAVQPSSPMGRAVLEDEFSLVTQVQFPGCIAYSDVTGDVLEIQGNYEAKVRCYSSPLICSLRAEWTGHFNELSTWNEWKASCCTNSC